MMQLIKLTCVFDKCRREGNRYNALLHRNANNERILGILAVIKRFCNVKKLIQFWREQHGKVQPKTTSDST